MNQAKQYLARYQQSLTLEEKKAVVTEYQAYLQTLSEPERDEAREIMHVLWPSIKQRLNELEPMMHTLEGMTNQLAIRQVSSDIPN